MFYLYSRDMLKRDAFPSCAILVRLTAPQPYGAAIAGAIAGAIAFSAIYGPALRFAIRVTAGFAFYFSTFAAHTP